jgi:hypothetical protein
MQALNNPANDTEESMDENQRRFQFGQHVIATYTKHDR